MTKDEALKMAIEFIDEITNAAGKYPYVNKTSLVADSYAMASKLKEALAQPSIAELNDEYLRDTHVEGLEQLAPSCDKVTRLEVIDNNGRSYVNLGVDKMELSYQDDGKTLKIFTNGSGAAPSWQGLSDDEIEEELKKMWDKGLIPSYSIVAFARAIEQALKEKNA